MPVAPYCEALHASINARLDGMDTATVIKAAETDRRLSELNNLRVELLTDRQLFVQRVEYDADLSRILKDNTESARRLAILETLSAAVTADVERRLITLNSLRAEVVADRVMFVPKITFDTKIERLESQLADLLRRITIMETRSIVWTSALGLGFVILQILIRFWN